MADLTTYAQTMLLNFLLTANLAAVTNRPTAWWVALHTGDPGADGSANEVQVAADADYVRKQVTFDEWAVGQVLNSSQVSWTIGTGTGYTARYGSIWTAATGGNCLKKGALLAARTLSVGGAISFEIGEIVAVVE